MAASWVCGRRKTVDRRQHLQSPTASFFPESASEGFLLCTPSPGGVDRAPREVPGNRKTNKNQRFFNGLVASAAETGQTSCVETGQMSAVETRQMSSAETRQMSSAETRQMSTSKTGRCPVSLFYICPVSTADICPVSTADVCPVSTCTSKDRKAH